MFLIKNVYDILFTVAETIHRNCFVFFQTNYDELKSIESFFDKDSLPFGMIAMETIEKAKAILKKIK